MVTGTDSGQELALQSCDIGELVGIEESLDALGQGLDAVAVGGDIEESDHGAAGVSGVERGIERVPCPGIGMRGKQGVSIDHIAQRLRLALQVRDEVPEIDTVPTAGMPDVDPVGGHHPVRPEEEVDTVVKQMSVEAPADEARRYRIDDSVDADRTVARDVRADQGEIGRSPRRQRLEKTALFPQKLSPAPILLGNLPLDEATIVC